MKRSICPGQDTRYWTHEHVYELPCAHCGRSVEFFKDDLRRTCPHCGGHTVNPKNDLACAGWCKQAAECLAQLGRVAPTEAPESAEDV